MILSIALPMPLNPDIQEAINKALHARADALEADEVHVEAVNSLVESQQAEINAGACALEKYREASDLAHDALVRVAAELGVEL